MSSLPIYTNKDHSYILLLTHLLTRTCSVLEGQNYMGRGTVFLSWFMALLSSKLYICTISLPVTTYCLPALPVYQRPVGIGTGPVPMSEF